MRESGILLPVASLPSRYGIGCLDQAAYDWIDLLRRANQSVWQVLPLGPTSFGDSPYQSFSTFAGNPYFISLDALIDMGLLTREECDGTDFGNDPAKIDYGKLYRNRFPLLRRAYSRWKGWREPEFVAFCRENGFWLQDYTLYMAIKQAHGGVSWAQWPEDLRLRQPEALERCRKAYGDEMEFYAFLQFMFDRQWMALKAYANRNGVRIISDIPIYVAFDSADTWANPQLFQLDENLRCTAIAGCPPDAFAADGQMWGNPLYRWEEHRRTGYAWWISRIRRCFRQCDVLRIDHFRGFDEYFSIPAADTTAKNGHWEPGPGLELFQAIQNALGEKEIIAEDLGYVTDSVRQLVTDTGYPGMKVMEFAFDSRDTGCANDYLPHNYSVNAAAYTGTHDNATLMGWFREITPEERQMVRNYVHSWKTNEKELCWDIICTLMGSVARLVVIPIQDYLALDNSARINRPSTIGTNWKWRITPGQICEDLVVAIGMMVKRYGRWNPANEETQEAKA